MIIQPAVPHAFTHATTVNCCTKCLRIKVFATGVALSAGFPLGHMSWKARQLSHAEKSAAEVQAAQPLGTRSLCLGSLGGPERLRQCMVFSRPRG